MLVVYGVTCSLFHRIRCTPGAVIVEVVTCISLIQDISFVVHPREQVALVGPCKASKTAIFDLIENFHDVQLGHIFLGK